MAPFKSSLARSAGKLFGVFRERDLSLRGVNQKSRYMFAGAISATGGESTFTQGDYKVHVYYTGTPSPQKVFNVTSGTGNFQIFMVGSGGSGAYDSGGGGGGGACVYGTDIPADPSMNLTVTVAAAPSAVGGYYSGPENDWRDNYSGKSSSITHPGGTINAYGGNTGGVVNPNPYDASPFTPGVGPGSAGVYGSGGGAQRSSGMGDNSTPVTAGSLRSPYPVPGTGEYNVYRNIGGNVPSDSTAPWVAGGGGGAGAVGGNSGPRAGHPAMAAGDGGNGYDAASNIPWMTTSYGASGVFGGGGGAGGNDGSPQEPGGAGGTGGGGTGTDSGPGNAGTANTGGGGSGADDANPAGAGGSGAVFIAYVPNS